MKLLTLVSRCSALMFYFECNGLRRDFMNRLQQNMRQQAEWMAKTNNYQCEMGFAAQVKI